MAYLLRSREDTAVTVPIGPPGDFGPTTMPAPLGRSLRVLVVEDDPVQALVLLTFLDRLGVSALHVRDGAHALAAAQADDFALVLMDYLMPDVDGIEATRMIRAWEESTGRPRLPIVAVTASAMKDECETYLAAGMDEVLVKPFAARELREVLVRHLSAKERGRSAV
jgi:CheY-like chemotaxis protein